MGLEFNKNKSGKYTVKSSFDDSTVLKNVSEKEVKKHLILEKFWRFMDDAIEIDMQFPNKYIVNGKMHLCNTKGSFSKWFTDNVDKENFSEIMYNKMNEIIKNLDISEYFEPFNDTDEEE